MNAILAGKSDPMKYSWSVHNKVTAQYIFEPIYIDFIVLYSKLSQLYKISSYAIGDSSPVD